PLAMLFGTIGAVAGTVALPAGQVLALLAWPFTAWLLAVTRLLARVPGAAVYVPAFGAAWLVLWYILLAGWAVWWARQPGTPGHARP
ncbi:MAG TPA: hypothetical protein VLA19_27220, partial [Herpetosiphonaceae bacterium]|nr:hypothetical protein [Herpetosiphonaceae bacterium]